MLIRDVEMFIEHCENKGLAKAAAEYEHGQLQRIPGFYHHSAFARYWHESQRMFVDSSNGCEFAKAVHLSPGGEHQRQERPLCVLL